MRRAIKSSHHKLHKLGTGAFDLESIYTHSGAAQPYKHRLERQNYKESISYIELTKPVVKMTSGTPMSNLAVNNLFNVNGIVAVITGGGTGKSL